MRERESQLERDVSVDVDAIEAGVESDRVDTALDASETDEKAGDGWLRSRLGSVATTRSLLVAFVLAVAGIVVFGAVPFLGVLGELLGIAAAGFAYGLGSPRRRYTETAVAGALVGGGSALLGNLVLVLAASGMTLLAVGLAGGALAGVVGHYFGRDLRHGLTRDLDEG